MKKNQAGKTIIAIVAGGIGAIGLLVLLAPLTIAGLFYLLVAQTELRDTAPDRFMFVNETDVPVYSVALNDVAVSDDILALGDEFMVDWETWPSTVSVYGENDLIAQLYLSEKPEQNWVKDCWYVIMQEGPAGLILTQSHAWPLEERVDKMGEYVGVDISAGVVELYYASGRGIHGDGSDYMALVFNQTEGAALEQMLAETQGWHQLPINDVIGSIFCGKTDCTSANHIFRVPEVDTGWYFFRDTYNANHGENDENQWEVEGRTRLPQNFTAGIYDSETNTLYLFDFDS